MPGRKLRRELNLVQVLMLGTAGTIAAEIFVLTGHGAARAGPATVLVVLVAGLLSYSVALNYCELATAFPETGGALTYVREAFGGGLLSFLVGSFDCLSSTFYAALSAVGFAYSLQVFLPGLPVVPVALLVVAAFVVLNILGVGNVANLQIALGGFLLAVLGVYVVGGFLLPGGFRVETWLSGGRFFIHDGTMLNLARFLGAMALMYNAYVGFEVIADDAEEVKDPSRNLPRAILGSLTLVMVIYTLVTLVTLGVIPWNEVAGSETALTDAVGRFLPGWGVPLLALAGIVATLTSVNTAMLSATREALTMSRDRVWPRFMSKLSRFRTPHMAILVIGAVIALVTLIGAVDFLAYISSSGYLFVLFWSNLAMIRLRSKYPHLPRPFRVPFFPLTAYLAAGTCLVILAFTEWQPLLFGAGLAAVFAVAYYTSPRINRVLEARRGEALRMRDRILVPVANPRTAERLANLATALAQASEDTSVCVLTVVPASPRVPAAAAARMAERLNARQKALLMHIAEAALARNVPLYAKLRVAPSIAEGIAAETSDSVKLILMGWPGSLPPEKLAQNAVKIVLRGARSNVGVLLDRGLDQIRQVLVPVGGGPHSRLALRLAYEIAEECGAQVTALHCVCEPCTPEELGDRMDLLREIIEDELGSVPPQFRLRLKQEEGVCEGVLAEVTHNAYDLLVVGASEEYQQPRALFGAVDDTVAGAAGCSVLMVRRYEPAVIAWIRRTSKGLDADGRPREDHPGTEAQGTVDDEVRQHTAALRSVLSEEHREGQ